LDALEQVDAWPVDHVAAGVSGPEDTFETHGPADRPFRLASVTKVLTAVAVLVAVEEGTVGLDEPAGPPGSTVRHLLAHASGLPFDGDRTPLTAPGRRRIYSNVGFEWLADHVAVRAGIDFATYATEAVIDPLGLTGTTLRGSPAAGENASTVDDVLALGRAWLRPSILAPETLAEATRPVFDLPGVLPGVGRFDPLDWGLGVEIRDAKDPHWTGAANSPETFGHFGGSGTFLWVDPVAGVICACLTDREFGGWALEAWPPFSDAVLTSFRPGS